MLTKAITTACCVCLCGAATFLSGAGAGELNLTKDGAAAAVIVTDAEPTRAAQFAAFELQAHILKISGATLPIVKKDAVPAGLTAIYVGATAFAKAQGLGAESLGSQEYAIRFAEGALILTGCDKDDRGEVKYGDDIPDAYTTWPGLYDEQGTLYAVYDFLQDACGVRWFEPSEYGTVCPSAKTLTVKVADLRRAPGFRNRNASVGGNPQGYDAVNSMWQPSTPQYKDFEAAEFSALHKKWSDGGQYMHAKRGVILLFQHRMKAGGEQVDCNHSLYGYYDRFWAPNKGNPEYAKHFVKRVPEMFAKGYPGGTVPPQMCYTSPELVRQVAADAAAYFDQGGYQYKVSGTRAIFRNPSSRHLFL